MKNESDNDEFHSDGEDWSRPVEDVTSVGPSSASVTGDSLGKQLSCAAQPSIDDSLLHSKLGHQRTVIHFDIDCFYAQVEMLRNPELRDKPLGIQQKYIVVTCNYVARSRGVTKLMGIKEARDKCPDLVLVCGEDLTHYRETSYRISEFLQQYTPRVERLGFDENFLDASEMVEQRLALQDFTCSVKGFLYGEQHAGPCPCGCHLRLSIGSQIAADIREALHLELGITCCAGTAHNKLLSKLVAGTHKPNQQTTLYPEHAPHLLASLDKARQIPGIGWNTAKKLSDVGIHSVTDVQECDMATLRRECGSSAATIRQLSHGVDDSPVVTFSLPQTISDEDSFKKCCTVSQARLKVEELLSSLLHRLAEDGRTPHTFRLTVRRVEGPKYSNRESRQCPVPTHFFHRFGKGNMSAAHNHLTRLAMKLFEKLVNTKQPFHLTLINVAFAKLEQVTSHNISSFFTPQAQRSLETTNEMRVFDEDNKTTKNFRNFEKKEEENSSSVEIQHLVSIKMQPDEQSAIDFVSRTGEDKKSSLGSFKKKNSSKVSISRFEIDTSKNAVYSTHVSIKEDGSSGSVNHRTNYRELKENERKPNIETGDGNNQPIKQCSKSTEMKLDKSSPSDCTIELPNRKSFSGEAVYLDENGTNEEGVESTSSTGAAAGCAHLPEGIDPDVFAQLPPEVQQEIVGEVRATRSTVYRATLDTPGRCSSSRKGSGKKQIVISGHSTFGSMSGEKTNNIISRESRESLVGERDAESEKATLKNSLIISGKVSCENISESPFKKRKRLFSSKNVKLRDFTKSDCNNNGSDGRSDRLFEPQNFVCGAAGSHSKDSSVEVNPSEIVEHSHDLSRPNCHLENDIHEHDLHGENPLNSGNTDKSYVKEHSSLNIEGIADVADVNVLWPENVHQGSREDVDQSSKDVAGKRCANVTMCTADASQHSANVTMSSEDAGQCSADDVPVSPSEQPISQFRCVTGPAPSVPPDMDEEVFRSLPVEIQAELSLQWQFQNIREKLPVPQKNALPKRKEQSFPRGAKRKSSNNMTLFNFFRNENK